MQGETKARVHRAQTRPRLGRFMASQRVGNRLRADARIIPPPLSFLFPKMADDEIASTSGVRPPRYRPELVAAPHTTGSRSGDYVEAIKLIDPVADLRDLKEIPCARKSLMAGIGSGAGIGLLRMMTGGASFSSGLCFGG